MKLDEMYSLYAQTVYKYLMSLCRDHHTAEELTQETFLKALSKPPVFDGSAKPSTWLCAIAKNAYISYLRKNKRRSVQDIENADLQTSEDPLGGMGEREIYKAIHSLPDPYKELILLRIHTDMTFEQIGEVMGMTENTARVTFYRGKEKLKKILDGQE